MKQIISLIALLLMSTYSLAQHSITLTWTASSDAAANPSMTYNVWRSSGVCGAASPMVQVATGLTALTYKDSAVAAAQTWCYGVTAQVGTAISPMSNEVAGTVPLAGATVLVVVAQ
jgi:hypothetical protein